MELTREYLKLKRTEMEQQLEQHLAAARRFEGAIITMNMMLEDIEKDTLETPEDVAELVGADSAEFIPAEEAINGETQKK